MFDALGTIVDLLRANVEIHVLEGERVFSQRTLNSDISAIYMLVGEIQRAFRESERKADLLGATWARKRREASERCKPLSKHAPGWLRLSEGEYHVIPDRKAVVLRIFDEASKGFGIHSIVERLNREKAAVFDRAGQGIADTRKGNGWSKACVHKMSASRAVLGEYQRYRYVEQGGKRARIPDGIPMLIFPRLVDEETWQRARAARESRRRKGGRGHTHRNLLRHLCTCARCHGPMYIRSQGGAPGEKKPGKDWLHCHNARSGNGCDHHKGYDYRRIERAILDAVGGFIFDPADLASRKDGGKKEALINEAERQIRALEIDNERLNREHREHPTRTLGRFVAENDAKIEAKEKEIARLKDEIQLERAQRPMEHVDAVRELRAQAQRPDLKLRCEARARLAQALRDLVESVTFFGFQDIAIVNFRGGLFVLGPCRW